MSPPFSRMLRSFAIFLLLVGMQSSVVAADQIAGRVAGGRQPIAGAKVSLLLASPDAPREIAAVLTAEDGSFEMPLPAKKVGAGVFYLIAQKGPAITLMATLGESPPKRVTVNELTTLASAWTGAQFLSGSALRGNALGLRIAAGNVPNLVDLETGELGPVIQDPLNSSQTTTLAKFNTLAILLSACVNDPQACEQLFAVATPPGGATPTDTLSAMQNIARYPWHNVKEIYALLDQFHPVPAGKRWRDTPFIPYLSFAPRAWTLSLVFAGGGLNSLGGIAIDGEGNMWADLNFLVGAQSTIYQSFGGGLGKIAPNGRPLSPMTLGYRGGGIDGPGFGIAISADDKVWATSLAGKNISVFDRKTGKPLSPESGYDFGGKLGSMQGIIVAPNGDVWALDNGNSQVVYLPQGDASRGKIFTATENGNGSGVTLPLKSPFHLAIDQQDRIWITNSGANTVIRFPAKDPSKFEVFTVGFAPRAVAIDSQGNAWVCNTVGHPDTREKLALIQAKLKAAIESRIGTESKADQEAKEWINLYEILQRFPGGDVSLIRPDGKVLGPFHAGKTITGPWGIAVDGNDNIWVANSTGRSVTQLCGVRPETCPPGFQTGDAISPPGGYIGGLQIITDVDVDPAGNLWVANNWDRPDEGFKEEPDLALSTRFGGNGTVVFYGLAKPVKTPLIGPVQAQ
ncbi:hypothetical protein LOC68_08315 [Blastopirellula sp. JC732]|uniref:SMP-30/Gluconolactonase/LRE-like region domain-containing protein n=1 Tax=Blastopirellula sediminis TaxID=2894196 RepID=A0A9X1MKS1_9BACT|nr:hypothetical protein [Blastopirellula sediminis]MCC9608827.1 hypothetical protein [Blastopirellula sediminis]MCC9628396.1 hypothetical protein [Blastopirellula sediminis]